MSECQATPPNGTTGQCCRLLHDDDAHCFHHGSRRAGVHLKWTRAGDGHPIVCGRGRGLDAQAG